MALRGAERQERRSVESNDEGRERANELGHSEHRSSDVDEGCKGGEGSSEKSSREKEGRRKNETRRTLDVVLDPIRSSVSELRSGGFDPFHAAFGEEDDQL